MTRSRRSVGPLPAVGATTALALTVTTVAGQGVQTQSKPFRTTITVEGNIGIIRVGGAMPSTGGNR